MLNNIEAIKLRGAAICMLENLGVAQSALTAFSVHDEVMCSGYLGFPGILCELSEDQKKIIAEIESEKVLVYHVIRGAYTMVDGVRMTMDTFLVVTMEDVEQIEQGESYLVQNNGKQYWELFAYVHNSTFDDGEYGYVGVVPVNDGLGRVY